MTPVGPEPGAIAVAVFVLAAFSLAGVCQSFWLASWAMPALRTPIDFGRTFRGRRVFGDHKTWRGFVVMIPATGASFAALHAIAAAAGWDEPLWALSTTAYGALGLAAGTGFMAGELPNSFVKRQLGIPPGGRGRGALGWCFDLVDRLDSVTGALVVLTWLVGVPGAAWLLLLVAGTTIHGAFSAGVARLGGKHRPVVRSLPVSMAESPLDPGGR